MTYTKFLRMMEEAVSRFIVQSLTNFDNISVRLYEGNAPFPKNGKECMEMAVIRWKRTDRPAPSWG